MLSQLTFRCDSPNRGSSRMNNSKHNIGSFRKRYSFVHLGDRKRLPECKDSAVVRGHSRSPWKWPVDCSRHSLNSVLCSCLARFIAFQFYSIRLISSIMDGECRWLVCGDYPADRMSYTACGASVVLFTADWSRRRMRSRACKQSTRSVAGGHLPAGRRSSTRMIGWLVALPTHRRRALPGIRTD